MATETIAAALTEMRRLQFVRIPPGCVAIGKADIESAGLDLHDVREWIAEHGGSEVRVLHRDRSIRGGRVTPKPPITSTYFQIPKDQLGGRGH